MITFFLPLGVESKWKDNETLYMLRSLEDNFQDPFEVIVASNRYIHWLKKVKWFRVEKFYPMTFKSPEYGLWFETFFDTLNKMKTFVFSDICPERFVYIYDDILLLKKIGEKDILPYSLCREGNNWWSYKNKTRQGKTIVRAAELLEKDYPYNYETHAPLIYERDRLREMFTMFPFEVPEVPYAIATLYFNIVYPDYSPYIPLQTENNYLAWFHFDGLGHDSHSLRVIEESIKDKVWVNYTDKALFFYGREGHVLMNFIENRFKYKSEFEK